MRCLVNGQEVPNTALVRREMNFSQPIPQATWVTYTISLPVQEFVDKLEKDFQRAAEEEKADARFHKKGEWPIIDRWEELDFPPPKKMLVEEPALLESLVQEYFAFEVLDRFLSGPEPGLPAYLINSLDRVRIKDGWIDLEGVAYQHPQWPQVSVATLTSRSSS